MGGPSGELLAALQTSVSDVVGSFRIERTTPVAGGCIHRCLLLEGGGRRYFAKTNARSELDNFAAEADGLAALSAAGARVPMPVCQGQAGEQAFLVLEHLELRGNGDYAALGRSLAKVHSFHGESFGWRRDNYIGRKRRSSIGARRHGATSGAKRASDLSSTWRRKTASGKVSWKKGSGLLKRYPDCFPNMRPPHRSCTAIYGVEMPAFWPTARRCFSTPRFTGETEKRTLL